MSPNFQFGVELFILALHSVPEYIMIPRDVSLAATVLAHIVFSMSNASSC